MTTAVMLRRSSVMLVMLVLAGAAIVGPLAYQKVFAATLTRATIQEIGGASNANPMIASDGQAFAVDFKTVGAGATTASINFNNFSGGTVNTTQTISSTGCTTYFPTATLLPGSLAASGSSTTISISSITALTATTEYCTVLTSTTAVTNPASGGVYSALITVGSDSQTAAFDVLSASANAYSITGTVSPAFTMALSGTCGTGPSGSCDNMATLSATALTVSSGITVTINTNAASGWNLYAMDSSAGLHSTSASHTIPSVSAGSNHTMNGGALGVEGYALGVSANSTANYAYNGGTTGGALSSSAFNQIATSASSAANVTQVLHELVNIAGTTLPGTDYTDTITVIGSGQF